MAMQVPSIVRPRVAIILLNGAPRLHDNPLWQLRSPRKLNLPKPTHALPVFCLDPRRYDLQLMLRGKTGDDGPKTRWFGIDDVVPQLIEACRANASVGADVIGVWVAKEISSEETSVELKLAEDLAALSPPVPIIHEWTSTIFPTEFAPAAGNAHPANTSGALISDLFGGPTFCNLPDVFTQFRKTVESKAGEPPEPHQAPTQIPPLPNWTTAEGSDGKALLTEVNAIFDCDALSSKSPLGTIPSMSNLLTRHESSVVPFAGGETAALARLEYYLQTGLVRTYKETRNGLLGKDYSTKFSPWLADGSLSARKVWSQVRKHEAKVGASDGSGWILFELLWREFFKFHAIKYGDGIFRLGGVHAPPYKQEFFKAARRSTKDGWNQFSLVNADPRWALPSKQIFELWAEGRTGIPFVDAGMRELVETG
ncbi:hypothetical protein HDU93_009892 [Gonapodya sp. JEL0774]|nr:hypothetical protein HDU93_009892 [Gonapodya sp. JEL0774]